MSGKSAVIVGLVIGLGPAAMWAGEWPQFRGPNSAGLAEMALPTEWSLEKNVGWKVQIPGVAWSSPIVWGEKVFVTTAVTDKQKKPPTDGGFGGFGPRGPGPGGRGRGGFPGRPQSGQILNPFLQQRLSLTADQQKQVNALQNEVDGGLAKILNEEQKKQLKGGGIPSGPGPRGPGAMGGRPQPGQILPSYLQDSLKLTGEQKKQVDQMQAVVDASLAKILNDEQKKELRDMREGFGRGGFGGGRPPDVVYRWQVYCLDRATGNVLWKQTALEGKPRIAIQQSNTYATETPVTDGVRVFAYFGMHGLFCYDFSGNLVWKKDLGAFPTQMGQGPASSPVLEGNRLFLQIDNEEKSFLVALDTKTGDELWRTERNERTNHCSPIIWKNRERTELVTTGSQKVRSQDLATGKLLWEMGMGGGRCYATPVGNADFLYVGCGAGFGAGGFGGPGPDNGPGDPGGAGPQGRRGGGSSGGGGLYAIRAGASGDLTLKATERSNAGVAWSAPKGGPEKASPMLYGGYLYVLRQNLIGCYDAKTGKEIYRERLPGAKSFWASPWAGEGKIFCLDGDGTKYVLEAGPQFKLLGNNKLNEMTWATPAVAGGSLIVRGVDHLYCIKVDGRRSEAGR
jgi:outer membrane protein assembly factor BamB